MADDKDLKGDEAILKKARERYALETEMNSALRTRQLEEKRFYRGDQWPTKIKHQRENDPYGARPCIVVNHCRTHCNSVVNNLRANTPQIHVLAVDNDADPETAEMLNGVLRHIQQAGEADLAYDTASESMVIVGEGYFEIIAREVSPDEQELDIVPIRNYASVHMDPYHESPTGSDAKWCFIDDPQLRSDLEDEYPDVELSDWSSASQDTTLTGWYLDENRINAARYYYLETTKATKTEPASSVWHVCKLVGDKILEKSTFPGEYLPIIRIVGEETMLDGKRDVNGLVRPLIDPCRLVNYWTSSNTEKISLAPKAPMVGAHGAFEGFETEWDRTNSSNIPRLTYNAYDSEGRPIPAPSRAPPIQQDMAVIQAVMSAHDDIKSVSGLHDSSLGAQGNETSGVAIANRSKQSDMLTYHFSDNVSRAIRQAGRVLVGLIPLVYTNDRIVRILGEDDSADWAELGATGKSMTETTDVKGKKSRIFDVSVGKFDVVVKAGPSFATRRQEAAAEMADLLARNPQAFQFIGHKLFRNLDWPGADECADILEAMLPPEVKQIMDAKKEGGDQVRMQVEMAQQAIISQVEPAMAQLQQQVGEAGQAAQQATQAAQQAMQENQMLKIGIASKDLENQKLQNALAEKAGELQIKASEVQAKLQAEQMKIEGDIVIATISQREESEEGHEPKQDEWTANTVAAQASQQAVEQLKALAQSLAEQTQEVIQATEETSRMLQGLAQGHQETTAEVIQLKEYVAASEASRNLESRAKSAKEKAVLAYLKSDGGDASMKKLTKTIETN